MNDDLERQSNETTTYENQPKKHSGQKALLVVCTVIAILIVAFGAGVGGTLTARTLWPEQSVVTQVTSGQDGNEVTTVEEATIASVVEMVSPSVVSIVTQTQTNSYYGVISQEGAGTGIIVSKDGYVMTNNHVIDGASKVNIYTTDGKLYDGVKVIGRDPLNDVAFLKIDSEDTFTPATLGDSSTVRIGQQVVAIGNALGQYQNTVTSGIISGTGRPITASTEGGVSESLTDLMQTDASINPGNSGGPLVNLSGQVIGINTAIVDDADNIGFAIPINSTKGVLAEVLASGKVQRAYMGVSYLSITPDIAREYDLKVQVGAFVYSESGKAVASGSPAAKAGLKGGDIIQKIDGYVIGNRGGLSTVIGQYRPGDTVTVTLLRDGKEITTELTFTSYNL